MHASWFSYAISKPYPFRWFTPTVLVGGVILTVLFSLVNLAPNGYQLRTTYTTDPNTTITTARSQWFWKAPFNWDQAADPKCEPHFVSVGDKFFSTNLGFYYEVTGISQLNRGIGAGTTSLPSVLYFNNTLEDCHTRRVEINLLKEGQARAPSWWISWRNSKSQATLQCSIFPESGPSNITLQISYSDPENRKSSYDNTVIYDSVINDNYTTHASTWWGTRLMKAYWHGVMTSMSHLEGDFASSNLNYYWNETRSPHSSIRDLDLFDLAFVFVQGRAGVNNNENIGIQADQLLTLLNNDSAPFSPVLTEGYHFAKVFSSVIAVDLGNTRLPNLLLDDDGLQYVTSGVDDINREPGGLLYEGLGSIPGDWEFGKLPSPINSSQLTPINESYSTIMPLMGPLGTKNATIITQYLCSVPERKNTGTLLFAIFIADLVLLQAAWNVLNWIAQGIMSRRDPTSMSCEGCLCHGKYSTIKAKEESRSSREMEQAVEYV